jgi:predicted RNase H-like HicB family nuclease
MKEYTIVIESGEHNFSAFVLDFHGCVATGRTIEEVTENMKSAIEAHLESLAEYGDPIPEPLDIVGATKVVV